MKIVILGAGNVATHLANAWHQAGQDIVQIYNRSEPAARNLAQQVNAGFTSNVSKIETADFYVIAVKDDAITEVIGSLSFLPGILLHTSGTKSLNLLSNKAHQTGVFYPLQTFKKNLPADLTATPILVEGSDSETEKQLMLLAKTISKNTQLINEEQRKWIHVAAVLTHNFSNHLFTFAEELLEKQNLSAQLLLPLLRTMLENGATSSFAKLQTGPAVRHDLSTIKAHLELLAEYPEIQQTYQLLTEQIMAHSGNQKHIKQ